MAVRQRFVYCWPEGISPVTFAAWLRKLNSREKDEFASARLRQTEFRQQAINQGRMTVEQDTYVWRDEQAAIENKRTDETWYLYFSRYLKETKTEFSIEQELC